MIRVARAFATVAVLVSAGCDRDYRVGALPGTCSADRATPALGALSAQTRSHWLQPWQKLTETLPGERLTNAIGWGIFATPEYAALVPRMAEAGLRQVTIPTYWSYMDFDDPTRLAAEHASDLAQTFAALRQAGIRPQLRLFSPELAPCPQIGDRITFVAAAPAGARTVRLDADSAARVRPGFTGLTNIPPTPRGQIAAFITSVAQDGTATLSKPLGSATAAGVQEVVTLRIPPFPHPTLADGAPSPAFAANVQHWLDYAMAVATLARDTLGDVGFDLLIGNEVPRFFDVANTYDPPPDDGPGSATETAHRLAAATIERLRRPGEDWSKVGVADSFGASDRSAGLPDALAPGQAIVRAAITGPLSFQPGEPPREGRSLDALGAPNGRAVDASTWREDFTPRYDAYFPERPLTALTANALMGDLLAARARGTAAPPIWIPSLGVNAAREQELGLAADGAAQRRVTAKAALRAVTSFVAAGATSVHLYGPIEDPRRRVLDPAAPDGGDVWAALRRLRARFDGRAANARALSLVSVQGCDGAQFVGDGTAAHPTLRDVDVVAFFPFQTGDARFVVPVYVMTRDLLRAHAPALAIDEPRRYDLPDEVFTLVVAGVDGRRATASLFDPLDGGTATARVVSREADRVTLELALTDHPRLLELADD